MPRMHADELDIGVELVRKLVASQFPEWTALPLAPVPSWGTDNALYRLGDGLVVRLPRLARMALTLRKERRWLPFLAGRLPLDIPVPVADGLPGESFPFAWAVYRWLEGEDATIAAVADELALAEELAGFLLALQAIDPARGPPPGEHNFFRGEPLAARDVRTRAAIETVGADGVAAVWDSALTAPEWETAPVWIHGDLDARNLLVSNGRPSAAIDWGGLGVGDPACDVAVAWKVLGADTRDAFRTALDVDDATWERGRGWVVSQAVGALAYYTEETNPPLVTEARRWLAEALTG